MIGNVAAAGFYIAYFMRGKSHLSISVKDFAAGDGICSGVLSIGVPASLAAVLMSVSQIIMNGMMAGYGDMAIAGMGVAMKVTMMTGMIAMGIGQGIQPLLGATGLVWAQPVADILSMVLAAVLYIRTFRKLACNC